MKTHLETLDTPVIKLAPAIQVDKGLPIPPRRGGGPGKDSWEVIRTMEIGDSFLWDGHPSVVYFQAKALGRKIKTRKESGVGRRVWRIA